MQADPTVTNTKCQDSFVLVVNAVNMFKKFTVNEYKSALTTAGVNYQTDLGYYSMVFKKFQEVSLTFFDFYA